MKTKEKLKLKLKISEENLLETKMALNTVQVDPIKYLSKLPVYDGDFASLYTFTDLIDRIGPILETYDEMSQRMFLDIIKARLIGHAKDIADINNHLISWNELKEVLVNNFGDRLSVEQLYDQMRSLKFKTNAKNFYDEIITMLRRLNMKTRTVHQNEAGYNGLITANKRTALEVFKSKLAEPMRSIIICRDPTNIENAIKILFDANYAYYNPIPNQIKNYNNNQSPNQMKNYSNNQNPNQIKNNNNQGPNQKGNNNFNPNQKKNFNRDRFDNHNGYQSTFFPNHDVSGNPSQMQPQLRNIQPNYQNFYNTNQNVNRLSNDDNRPVPMEVGNFHRGDLTNSPT